MDYATVPVTASLAASYLGMERMGLAMGMIAAGHALGGAMGAYSGGYLFDAYASYSLVWWSGAGLSVIAALIAMSLDAKSKRRPALVA
ncbi:MAG: hypothetical protein LH632_21195 [Rhodoferax sp.]|nr:hypothetical protein [Rhodoferax sp.]